MNLQVTSTCEAHKTLEGLQKSKMTCWKKGEMARGRCGRRDLVFAHAAYNDPTRFASFYDLHTFRLYVARCLAPFHLLCRSVRSCARQLEVMPVS